MIGKLLEKNTKLFLVAILVTIIALSGCIGGGDSGIRLSGAGGDALELSIDTEGRTTFDSLEPFIITVQAENVGEFDADAVTARLQGYDGIIPVSVSRLSDYQDFVPSNLERPNYENDVPGGTGDVDWDVKAPYLSSDAPDVNLNLIAEILYDSKSLAARKVVIATATEIEKLEQRGESVSVESSTEALNGPVSIQVETDEPYLRMSSAKEEFRLTITLLNDGNGNVYDRGATDENKRLDYLSKATLKVPAGLDVDEANCDFELVSPTSGSIIDAEKTLIIDDGHGNSEKLRLTEGGSSRNLNCRLTAFSDDVAGFNTYNLQVVVDYTYLQSITKKITIQGTEEAPLRVQIEEPTRSTPDIWDDNEQHHVYFTMAYQAKPVSSVLSDSDVKAEVGGLAATTVNVTYDTNAERYDAVVTAPVLTPGTYDLDIEATYAGVTAIDIESSAVEYK